jgi:hypothetical protein
MGFRVKDKGVAYQGDCMYAEEKARRATVTVVIEPVLPVTGVQ